jgi:hypothetical protein
MRLVDGYATSSGYRKKLTRCNARPGATSDNLAQMAKPHFTLAPVFEMLQMVWRPTSFATRRLTSRLPRHNSTRLHSHLGH